MPAERLADGTTGADRQTMTQDAANREKQVPGAVIGADSITGADSELGRRVIAVLAGVRLFVAAGSLLLFFLGTAPRFVGEHHPALFAATAAAYLILAIFTLPWLRRPAGQLRLHVQMSVDIAAILLLMYASGGISSGLGGLLVIFIGGASLVMPGRLSLFFAALAAIGLLFSQLLSVLRGAAYADSYPAAGILGAVIFVVALAARPLARRIRESEALAHQRGVDLANMAELNQYIVQHLRESIVVIDADDRVRLINESAAHLLRTDEFSPGLPLAMLSGELDRHVSAWRSVDRQGPPPEFTIQDAEGGTSILVHLAPFGRVDRGRGPVLIFLEDASLLAERVQQSKLASLGRLSASIAHEIRNPVGAMSHAGQLLQESPSRTDEDHRLIEIILSHSERVSHIIDNILQLSRRDTSQPKRFALRPWVVQFADEFSRTMELREGELTVAAGDANIEVRMDRSHLRQVLWNLCDNAVKYASDTGGIEVVLQVGRVEPGDRPYLEVLDRGHGVDPGAIDKIFEPFFTAQQGGTGLGLYISRELCELNRAALSYRPRDGGGSIFRIVFADPNRWQN
jgi:two-component system sensor histidine kinase PilS (NtrC family)